MVFWYNAISSAIIARGENKKISFLMAFAYQKMSL